MQIKEADELRRGMNTYKQELEKLSEELYKARTNWASAQRTIQEVEDEWKAKLKAVQEEAEKAKRDLEMWKQQAMQATLVTESVDASQLTPSQTPRKMVTALT